MKIEKQITFLLWRNWNEEKWRHWGDLTLTDGRGSRKQSNSTVSSQSHLSIKTMFTYMVSVVFTVGAISAHAMMPMLPWLAWQIRMKLDRRSKGSRGGSIFLSFLQREKCVCVYAVCVCVCRQWQMMQISHLSSLISQWGQSQCRLQNADCGGAVWIGFDFDFWISIFVNEQWIL